MNALVAWTPNVESDLAGYEVGHGYAAGEYFEFVTVLVPAAQHQFTGLDDFKEHHFAVRAFDNKTPANVSALSVDVSKRLQHRFTMK